MNDRKTNIRFSNEDQKINEIAFQLICTIHDC